MWTLRARSAEAPITTTQTTRLTSRWRRIAVPLTLLRLAGQGSEFVAWAVIARRLGASAFGTLAVAFLVARYAGLVGDWGAVFRGARDVAAEHTRKVSGLIRVRAWAGAGLAVVYVGGALVAGHGEFALLAIVILGYAWSRDWVALGREQGVRAALPVAVRGALVLAGSVTVDTPEGAALVVALGYGVGTGLSWYLNPHPREEPGQSHSIDAWMLLAVVMSQIYTSLDTVLLATLRTTREAGIYAAVYRIPQAWVALVGLLVAGLVPIATSTLSADPKRLPALRRRAHFAGGVGAAAVVLSIPILVPMTTLIFGGEFGAGRTALALILVATAVATLSAPVGAVYLGVGRDRDFALVLTAGAVVNVGVNLFVIPRYGMNGAAITTIASEGLVLVALSRLLARY